MNGCIVLLDGAKGAGKTTVSGILQQCSNRIVCLSLDIERRALDNQERSRTELNAEAFENILKKTAEKLDNGGIIVIDCGLKPDRVSRIDSLAADKNVKVYKFLLKAPYEVLLDRVHSRDSTEGKETDEKRFEEIYNIVHGKELDDFNIIETDKLRPEEIADKIGIIITR